MFAEGLRNEIGPLGLRSIIFEPGGFDSELAMHSEDGAAFAHPPKVEGYAALFEKLFQGSATTPSAPKAMAGDVAKIADAIIDVVKGEGLAKGRLFPVRVVLGPDALDAIRQKCTEQLRLLDDWEDVTLSVMKEGQRKTSPWLLDNCSILK